MLAAGAAVIMSVEVVCPAAIPVSVAGVTVLTDAVAVIALSPLVI